MSKCLKFWPGIEILKFKADFYSKICVCRHELGVLPPNPPAIPTLRMEVVITLWRKTISRWS